MANDEIIIAIIMRSPIFATDSVIVKGLHIQNDLLGIIPSNYEYFENISESFHIIDLKLQKIYIRWKNLLKKPMMYFLNSK